jgi:hypothetical protein
VLAVAVNAPAFVGASPGEEERADNALTAAAARGADSDGFGPRTGSGAGVPDALSDSYLTLNYVPLISPYRSLDTRRNVFGRQYVGEPPLSFNVLTDLNDVRQLQADLEAEVYAVTYNLTVTATEGSGGYLTVYPGDVTTAPEVSSINWSAPGIDIANSGVARIADNFTIKIVAGGPVNASAHVILDITGVFVRSNV